LRILLTIHKGCIDYESIKTIDGKYYETYQEACYVLGLLVDDKEYIDAIKEASEFASGHQLRRLFVTLLSMNTISKPDIVWNSTWSILCDGILYQKRKEMNLPGILYCFLFNLLYIYILIVLFTSCRSSNSDC